jgi:hypothetical protein
MCSFLLRLAAVPLKHQQLLRPHPHNTGEHTAACSTADSSAAACSSPLRSLPIAHRPHRVIGQSCQWPQTPALARSMRSPRGDVENGARGYYRRRAASCKQLGAECRQRRRWATTLRPRTASDPGVGAPAAMPCSPPANGNPRVLALWFLVLHLSTDIN